MRKSKVTSFYEVRDLTAKLNSYPGIDINLNPSGAGTKAPEEEGDGGDERDPPRLELSDRIGGFTHDDTPRCRD